MSQQFDATSLRDKTTWVSVLEPRATDIAILLKYSEVKVFAKCLL